MGCASFLIIFTAVLAIAFSTNNVLTSRSGSDEDGVSFSSSSPRLPLIRYKNILYYIGSIYNGTASQAEIFCRYHNMKLVSIENLEENDFVIFALAEHFVGTQKDSFWFWSSGKRYDDEEWLWDSTGNPVNYANWNPGEPTHNPNENCIEMRYSNKLRSLFWVAQVCEFPKYFICESREEET